MGKCGLQAIQKKLAKQHACYVLITCGSPSDEGNMEVEMHYGGDAALASLLLEGAQTVLDGEEGSDRKEPNLRLIKF